MTMKKRKWFLPVVLSLVLIGGITGGVVAAMDNSSSNSTAGNQTTDRYQALLDKACAIYEEKTGVAIDSQQLEEALQQARSEMRDEALRSWLQNLVDKGKITQQKADQYLEWWQSRPDIKLPLPRLGEQGRVFGHRGGPWCAGNASDEAGS